MFFYGILQSIFLQMVFRKLSKGGEGGTQAWKKRRRRFDFFQLFNLGEGQLVVSIFTPVRLAVHGVKIAMIFRSAR